MEASQVIVVQHIYDCITINPIGDGYYQIPGDFSDLNLDIVTALYGGNSVSVAQNIRKNMFYDLCSLGYCITDYDYENDYELYNSIQQADEDERLVALVTNIGGFHFYMQNSDGTWSHKNRSEDVTNKSLRDQYTVLTNSNIVDECLGNDDYETMMFFCITKPSTVEFRHESFTITQDGRRHCNMVSGERAGDYLENSVDKSYGTTSGRIDHSKDHDVFCYIPTQTRDYTVFTNTINNNYADINCSFYDGVGTYWQSDTSTGDVYITLRLVAGKKYFIDIWDNNERPVTKYNLSIY